MLAAPDLPQSDARRRPTPVQTWRTFAAVLVGLITAVVLSGCIKIDLNMVLHEDNTANADVIFAVQDSVARELNTTPTELWAQVEAEIVDDWPEGTTSVPYSEGGYTGSRLTIPNGPLTTIDNITGQPFTITRQGDEFFISGEMDLDQLATEEGADQAFVDSMQAQIAITCPGSIIESNGTVTGNTVTWVPTTAGLNQFTARCSALGATPAGEIAPQTPDAVVAADADTGVPRWIPALGVAFVLGLGALAWFLWRHSHHHEDQEYLGLEQFDDHGHFDHHEPAGYAQTADNRVMATQSNFRDAQFVDADFRGVDQGVYDGLTEGYGESNSGDGSGYDVPSFGDGTRLDVTNYGEGDALVDGPGSRRPEWD